MKNKVKIGITICDRYKTCAGGKCFRAMKKQIVHIKFSIALV